MQAAFTRLVLVLFSILAMCQCSGTFDKDWPAALAAQKAAPAQDISGPWIGTWLSQGSHHGGQLRCIVSQADAKTGQSKFHYSANFMHIASASYEVTHLVKRAPEGFTFTGDQKLTGLGGGLYHYVGKATPTTFHATYRSENDYGVFDMTRPK